MRLRGPEEAKRSAAAAAARRGGRRFTFCELFAGIGGFRVALDSLGGRCVFASEIDEWAAACYAANFGDVPSGDITTIDEADVPAFDLLTAGFPCQPFSMVRVQWACVRARACAGGGAGRAVPESRPCARCAAGCRLANDAD